MRSKMDQSSGARRRMSELKHECPSIPSFVGGGIRNLAQGASNWLRVLELAQKMAQFEPKIDFRDQKLAVS